MNGGVETEEITSFPLNLTCCKYSRPYPTVSQYQLDAYKIHDIFASPNLNHQIGSRDIVLQTGYASANPDVKAEADTDANGIHIKNSMSHSPCWADIINQLWYLVAKPIKSNQLSNLYCASD